MAAGVQTPLLWKLEQTCMWHSIPKPSQRELPPSPETWGPMGSPGISRPLQAVRKIAAPTAPLGKGRNLNSKVGQDLSNVVMFFCLSLSTFSRSRELPSTCFELYSGSRFNRERRLSPILFLCRSAAPGCVSSRFRTLQAFLPDVQAAWSLLTCFAQKLLYVLLRWFRQHVRFQPKFLKLSFKLWMFRLLRCVLSLATFHSSWSSSFVWFSSHSSLNSSFSSSCLFKDTFKLAAKMKLFQSASLGGQTGDVLVQPLCDLPRDQANQWTFSMISTGEFNRLPLSVRVCWILASDCSSSSPCSFCSCPLLLSLSFSGEHSGLCWRWMFPFQPSIIFFWRCHALLQDVFKLYFSLATWDWWDFDVSPRECICWRWTLISTKMKVERPHFSVLFQGHVPCAQGLTWSESSTQQRWQSLFRFLGMFPDHVMMVCLSYPCFSREGLCRLWDAHLPSTQSHAVCPQVPRGLVEQLRRGAGNEVPGRASPKPTSAGSTGPQFPICKIIGWQDDGSHTL